MLQNIYYIVLYYFYGSKLRYIMCFIFSVTWYVCIVYLRISADFSHASFDFQQIIPDRH